MATKTYTVFFAKILFTDESNKIKFKQELGRMFEENGKYFPIEKIENSNFQIRDLAKVGKVWKGVFGKLRDDAPHIVGKDFKEKKIQLKDDERVLDKCYFMYYETTNVLVWQSVRSVSGLSKFEDYLSKIVGRKVLVTEISNKAEIDEILNKNIYEVFYSYNNPAVLDRAAPDWSQNTFDAMRALQAGYGKFSFRAYKDENLSEKAKRIIGEMLNRSEFNKIKVRIRDDDNPVELFSAPIKTTIKVELIGGYPIESKVFEELVDAYDSVKNKILLE